MITLPNYILALYRFSMDWGSQNNLSLREYATFRNFGRVINRLHKLCLYRPTIERILFNIKTNTLNINII